MRVSLEGLAEIAGHEGIVPMPYRDSVGVWTVGIGHTASAGLPNPATMPRGVEIPLEEVLSIFARDIENFSKDVSRAVKVPVSQHEFDALVSFHYNTGGIARAILTQRLNAGDRAGAASAFMNWRKPPEITARRQAEMRLFRTGSYGSGFATIYPADNNGKVLWGKGRRVNVRDLLKPGDADKLPLRRGSRGDLVKTLQTLLNDHGSSLFVDGDFGPLTEQAVTAYQRTIFDDFGVVGDATWTALTGTGDR